MYPEIVRLIRDKNEKTLIVIWSIRKSIRLKFFNVFCWTHHPWIYVIQYRGQLIKSISEGIRTWRWRVSVQYHCIPWYSVRGLLHRTRISTLISVSSTLYRNSPIYNPTNNQIRGINDPSYYRVTQWILCARANVENYQTDQISLFRGFTYRTNGQKSAICLTT